MSAVGDMLRRAREAKGWSQAELASKVGRTRSWVSLVESGGIDGRASVVALACIRLGVGVDALALAMRRDGAAEGKALREQARKAK